MEVAELQDLYFKKKKKARKDTLFLAVSKISKNNMQSFMALHKSKFTVTQVSENRKSTKFSRNSSPVKF
jgi:hypothetical protein